MKKGKIATLAAFCALFAALCLTACGDEGKENATPLPTNTATQTETAKPTEKPTEVPTVKPTAVPTTEPTAKPTKKPTAEPTAVPTEGPVLEKNYVPVKAKKLSKEFCLLDDADANGFEIDEALAYKIFKTTYPGTLYEGYMPYSGKWIPEGTRENDEFNIDYCEFKFIDSGDYLTVLTTTYHKNNGETAKWFGDYTRWSELATFTYTGELIEELYPTLSFAQFQKQENLFFSYNNKLYFAVICHLDIEPPNGTSYDYTILNKETGEEDIIEINFNPFWIYELGKDSSEMVWDEFVLSQYDELFNNDLSDREAVFYKFKDDGVDFYLLEENSEKRNLEYIYHISFKQLLDDLNSGITKRKEAPKLTAKDVLEYKMFLTLFPKCTDHVKGNYNWYNPKNRLQPLFQCEFTYTEDCIIFEATEIPHGKYRPKLKITHHTATFSLDGELIEHKYWEE